jgi:hypothetical protein
MNDRENVFLLGHMLLLERVCCVCIEKMGDAGGLLASQSWRWTKRIGGTCYTSQDPAQSRRGFQWPEPIDTQVINFGWRMAENACLPAFRWSASRHCFSETQ